MKFISYILSFYTKRNPVYKKFFEAAKNNDIETVRELVESNAVSIDIGGHQNNTALHIAARSNNEEIAKYLLENGANPNATNYSEITPLLFAIDTKNLELVKMLHENGSKLEHLDYFGRNALMKATSNANDSDMMEFLIEHNLQLDINQQDKYGNTALHYAAFNNQPIAVNLLLANGADAKIINLKCETALDKAKNARSYETEVNGILKQHMLNLPTEQAEECEHIVYADEQAEPSETDPLGVDNDNEYGITDEIGLYLNF